MKRKRRIFFAALIVLNLLLIAALAGRLWSPGTKPAEGGPAGLKFGRATKTSFYIGLNDKDAYKQLIPTDEARRILDAVAGRHADGFSVFSGAGYWRDGKGEETREESLVYVFFDLDRTRLTAILDEMLLVMNQSAILVESEEVAAALYEGAE